MDYYDNNKRLVLWLSVALVIIILIVGGAFAYFKFFVGSETEENASAENSSPENYQIPMGVNVPSEDPAKTDPTIDWLPFEMPATATATESTESDNAKLFSFKYPKDLELQKNENNIVLSSVSVTSTQLVINWENTDKSLEDYLKDFDKISAKAWEGKPSIEVSTSTDQASFAGLSAVVREQKLLAADLSEYVVYFKSSSTVYSIGIIAPELNQNLVSFLVLFMNTFKLGN